MNMVAHATFNLVAIVAILGNGNGLVHYASSPGGDRPVPDPDAFPSPRSFPSPAFSLFLAGPWRSWPAGAHPDLPAVGPP